MRFSEAWLREWVNPEITTEELSDQLTMAGLEVDSVEPAAAEFSGVVIGEVISKGSHPDADKLSVCTVDVGEDETLQIVCGAQNVAADMRVPVAVVGAVLPGGFEIKKANLRGAKSMGMICSAAELGLEDASEGIMPLPHDAPIGADFRDYLSLNDVCIEVDLTPDRGDCLSVAGIAREVGVINRVPVKGLELKSVFPAIEDVIPVEVEAPEACPRYICRIIKGINPQAETPQWMIEKLRRGGLRSIGPVVDVTNFVLLELGQPMHAFDLATIQDSLHIRLSEADETLELLDGSTVGLQPGSLLIADAKWPVALAGIMGGAETSVTEDTNDILLESAFFTPMAITGKARAYGLHTDASHRFERGVDSDLQMLALDRATSLLMDIVGGEPGPAIEVVSDEHLPRADAILLRRPQIARILGVDISDEDVMDIFTRLGMQIAPDKQGWLVTPPSARFDITIEADLLEELGRIYGYDNIPENLSAAPVSIQSQPEASFQLSKAKQTLVARDYHEIVTYSFISPALAELLTPEEEQIQLANPISSDMSVMRASLWPGLLSALQYNLARQQDRVRLFESGLRFVRRDGHLLQEPGLAGLVYGSSADEQWAEETGPVDFFDLKADLESILGQVEDLAEYSFEAGRQVVLHPGQTAIIKRQQAEIGSIGMLHPEIQSRLDIVGNVYLFEISLNAIASGGIPAFTPVSRFPAIRRDLAIVVDQSVPVGDILATARGAAPDIIRDIKVFDVYLGEKIDFGLKSIALSLILQETSRTLTDEEVEETATIVLDSLASKHSARLRD